MNLHVASLAAALAASSALLTGCSGSATPTDLAALQNVSIGIVERAVHEQPARPGGLGRLRGQDVENLGPDRIIEADPIPQLDPAGQIGHTPERAIEIRPPISRELANLLGGSRAAAEPGYTPTIRIATCLPASLKRSRSIASFAAQQLRDVCRSGPGIRRHSSCPLL